MHSSSAHLKTEPSPAPPGGCREVLRMAWPLIISTGSFTIMMFCDRMFLAWHSPISIQAALPAGLTAFTLICGFMAMAAYATTFVAQYHGADNPRGCSQATAQGIFLSLLSWPALILLIPPGIWMLRMSGHAPGVLAAEIPYFTILMIGGVTSPLGAAASSFFTGRGLTRITMLANVTGNLCNIFLDYVLIFGAWGFPALGMNGAAWATVISGFISPAILLVLFFSGPINRCFSTRLMFRFNKRLFWRMIRFGFPSGIHLSLDIASFSIFVLLTGRMGPLSLAASNIALSINLLAFLPLVGIGIAASTLVGQYQGRQRSDLAEKSGWSALKLGMLYMLLAGSTFVLFPEAYYRLFAAGGHEALRLADLLPVGRILLVIMAAWGLLDAGNMIIGSALKGAGDTRFVMYYSVAMAWCLLVPGQFLLVVYFQRGIILSWLWTALYIMALAAGYLWRFKAGRWRSIDLLDRQTPLEPARPAAEALIITD